MSVPSSSARAALEGLVGQLRNLRLDAGLNGTQLAAAVGWHRTKVSHIENARRAPSTEDVRAWCRACGADTEVDDLVATLRQVEGAYVQWRRLMQTGLRRLQESYVPLYEQTQIRRVYSAIIVPGLLQTREYATALLGQIAAHNRTPNDLAEAVEARMQRRRVLHGGGQHAFLLEESVLTHGLGGYDVMAGQLRQLISDMALPSVSIGIIPATADRPRWPLETFTMFDEDLVRVELLAARVSITAPGEITQYAAAFRELAAMAIHGAEARRLVDEALDHLARRSGHISSH